MSLIESNNLEGAGLHPILIRDTWQVVELNYPDKHRLDNILDLTKHQKSDKGASLLVRKALLITSLDQNDFEVVRPQRGISYHIPQNLWYAVAMSEGSKLFIVGKPYYA